MRRASVFAALILSVFVVQPASAAVIGVRGVDSGSENATDGGAFELTPCNALLAEEGFEEDTALTNLFCVVYRNDFGEDNELGQDIYALDFAFWDEFGQPRLVADIQQGAASQFELIRFFPEDPYLVRLCTNEVDEGIFACGGILGPDPVILAGSFFVAFTDFKGFVSIQGINGISNSDAAVRGQSIPEPATLLLMGLGIATAAGRRLRHRRK